MGTPGGRVWGQVAKSRSSSICPGLRLRLLSAHPCLLPTSPPAHPYLSCPPSGSCCGKNQPADARLDLLRRSAPTTNTVHKNVSGLHIPSPASAPELPVTSVHLGSDIYVRPWPHPHLCCADFMGPSHVLPSSSPPSCHLNPLGHKPKACRGQGST